MADPTPKTAKPSLLRRLWCWTRWLFLLAIVSIVTLAVFHQQLILWALNRFSPDVAKSLPLALKWHVGGSLWHDLSINDVVASSDDEHLPLRSLKIGRLEVKHDVHPAFQGDYFSVAKSITLHDVDAVIDLRHPSAPKPKTEGKPADKQAIVDLLKKIVWPDIDLKNVNATVLLPDATLRITGVDLNLPAGKQGMLHIGSIEHPALTQYPLRDVSARLGIHGAKVLIEAFKLPPQLEIERLSADASEYGQGKVSAQTVLRSGGAKVEANAGVDLSNEHPLLDVTMDVNGIDEKEIGRWVKDMPPAKAKIERLHITAKGDPMLPRKLDAKVFLDVRDIAYQDYRCENVGVDVTLAAGKLEVSPLLVITGGNRFMVNTEAEAPAEWSGFARTPLSLHWGLQAPTPGNIMGLPVKLSGSIEGEGVVKLTEQGLQSFESHLEAKDVAVDQHKLRSLEVTASGDLKTIRFDARAEASAGDGKLNANGQIGLAGGNHSALQWQLVVPKPDELARSLGIEWPADVSAGEVSTDGAASFDLAKLKASNFDDAAGHGSLLIKQSSWKGAQCEEVIAEWRIEKGKATIPWAEAKMPGGNSAYVQGSLALSGGQEFEASTGLLMPFIDKMRPWLDAAGANSLQSGNIALKWKGTGKLRETASVNGSLSIALDKVRIDSFPDELWLEGDINHDSENVKVQKIEARLGPWFCSLSGAASRKMLSLERFRLEHQGKELVTGELRVPLALDTKPLPVDQTQPLHVRIDTTGRLSLSELATLAKQSLPPELAGFVSASIALDGPLPKLQARVAITADELHLPKMPSKDPGKVDVLLTLDDGELHLKTLADVKPLEPLLAEMKARADGMALIGDPKLAMSTPFEATVKLNQPTLDFLKPMVPMLDELRGSVLVDVKADGTAATPHVHGSVKIDVPVITPHDPDLPLVKDFKTEITADDTTVQLKTLHAIAAGGELTVSGKCELKDTTKPIFDVALKARDLLAIRNEMMTLRTDADLRCAGSPAAASLTGSIGLTRGRVFQEVDFLPLNKMMNDLPPLPDQKASKPSAEPNASPLPPMLKDWSFDLGVKTKDDIRLLGNVMNGGVMMDLKLTGTGASPKMLGEVKANRAVLNLPFSTLRIRDGVVHFGPDDPLLAPSLQLLAESTVDAYEIDLRGFGSVLDPKIHFSSTPPLPEGEIAMLLATGSTTSGLTKGGGDTAGRALLFVIREAYRRMFISKNSKPKKPGEKEDESRFIVQERSEDGKLGGVTGIYEISRKMKIVGSTDKDGGFRAMFHYLFHFD